MSAPPAISPTGELELDVGSVALFGSTDVKSLRRLWRLSGGRALQDEAEEDEAAEEDLDFAPLDIDVRQFMSFELVRG